jgi:hypothetical protein
MTTMTMNSRTRNTAGVAPGPRQSRDERRLTSGDTRA